MPDPTMAMIHVDTPLTNIAIAYQQDSEDYIAAKVFPEIKVSKQSDKYFIWTKGFWLRNAVERRAPGDFFPEGRLQVSNDTYYAELYHLGYGIPDEHVANQDEAIELSQTGAEWIAGQFLLNREITVADAIFAINVWETDVVGGVGFTLWDDYDNSNPVTDMLTGMRTIQQSTGKKANTLILGKEVLDILVEHPMLLDKFKHTGTGILDQEQVRQALRVQTLLVGESIEETSMEGDLTPARGYIWGSNALLCHVPASPGKRVAAAGYTFTWELPGTGGLTVGIETERQNWRKRDLLMGMHAFDPKVTGTDLGYFFSEAIA